MTDERPLRQASCSFCRRESTEVVKLVLANDGAICDECIGLCLGCLAQDSAAFEATVERARTIAATLKEAIAAGTAT